MTGTKPFDYTHLNVQERIQLAQELWDSVREAADDIPLTEAQQQELDRRWNAFEAGEMTAAPWPEVKKRLLEQ